MALLTDSTMEVQHASHLIGVGPEDVAQDETATGRGGRICRTVMKAGDRASVCS
jgi:hypothetical protein